MLAATTVAAVNDFYRQFGQNLRRHRRLSQMSQEELADLTQMGRATIASIEAGRQAVALHQALKLGEALRTDLRELIADTTPSELRQLQGVLRDSDLRIVLDLHEKLP